MERTNHARATRAARPQPSRSQPVPVAMRVAGAAALIAAGFVYWSLGGGWGLALALLLAPDLAFAAFLFGVKPGVAAYNAVHRPIVPIALLAVGLVTGLRLAALLALIWVAHIAMDRAAGYGLREVVPAPEPGSPG
ncbi:MAG: DUF4260 family protein [Candidatus Dormibacterales bacterium]